MGYNYLQNGNVSKAIEIFSENVKRYPLSSNVYDGLGEAYEKNNQLDLAAENYEKAFDLGRLQNHRSTGIYQHNLERVKKQINSN